MSRDLEELASKGVHDKVFEVVTRLPGNRVLDVPVGPGALTRRFLEAGKTVTAGDIDLEVFRLARGESIPNFELVKMDLTASEIPLKNGFYDIAVCVEGIEHLENQWNLVRNLNRALAPGGHLVLTTPNILNFTSRFRYFTEGCYDHFKRPLVVGKSIASDMDTYHIAPISYFEMQFILGTLGFEILNLYANWYKFRNPLTRALHPLFHLSYLYKNYRDKKRGRGDFLWMYKLALSDELFYGDTLIVLAKKLRDC